MVQASSDWVPADSQMIRGASSRWASSAASGAKSGPYWVSAKVR